MEGKPNHYDGSMQAEMKNTTEVDNETFILTEEARKNITGNPFFLKNEE
ncbi:hypothetical protein FIU87_05965 [Bacillus sp. THAF10]|nr:hypothetical protein [Bacillus sp. THAF10]QFT88179.1 hypothetical protein FIU87_05965 [Bacillus sp. THAF10]